MLLTVRITREHLDNRMWLLKTPKPDYGIVVGQTYLAVKKNHGFMLSGQKKPFIDYAIVRDDGTMVQWYADDLEELGSWKIYMNMMVEAGSADF